MEGPTYFNSLTSFNAFVKEYISIETIEIDFVSCSDKVLNTCFTSYTSIIIKI